MSSIPQVEPRSPADPRGATSVVPFLAAALLLAGVGIASTTPIVSDWFRNGPRLAWTPALAVVAAIWTTADLLNGMSGWLIRRSGRTGSTAAYRLWTVQYALQLMWLIAFMVQGLVAGRLLWAVLVLLLLLDLATAATAFAAWRVSRPAAVLLLVILAWLLYGTAGSWGETALRMLDGI